MGRLQERDLWYDEAFAVLYSSLSPEQMVYGTVTPVSDAGAADVHPLLYYFILHGWMGLAGSSPLAARFLSVILGMITVGLLWRLADGSMGRRVGLAAALLAAANPFHVAYSQEARMYALLALAAVAATWGLLRALGDSRGRWWILYVVGAALTLYAHNLGAFHLAALHFLVLARRQWRRRLAALLLADAAVAALFLPWLLAVLPGQLGFVGRGYWVAPPGVEQLVRASMLPILTFYEQGPVWLTALALSTGLLLLALLLRQSMRRQGPVAWFVLLAWGPVVLLFIVSLIRPVYLERALLPSSLFYLVAIGWLFAGARLPRAIWLVLTAMMVAATGASLANHYAYSGFPRPPFAEAAAYLEAHVEAGDAVVHTNKLSYFPMLLYDPDMPAAFLADPPGSPQDTLALPTQEALGIYATAGISEAVGGVDRVWLVYFEREIEETRQMGEEHVALSWIQDRYRQTERQSFEGLEVVLLERDGS